MLTANEKNEISAHLADYRDPRGAIVEALKIVQAHRGWVSDEALADVAGALGMSPDEVDSIATFYTMIFRRPVGRHVILLCDSVSCGVTGYEELRGHLATSLGIDLGQTTADGRFTLLPTVCLGACELAPVMMVDKVLYGNLTPAKADEVLAKYP
jgi:NADH-quinone oxidoreductase subunit E